MKINELIYQTPEMTEEKLLEIMSSHLSWLKRDFVKRIEELHKGKSLQEALLMEYDNIQDKKSYLTKSQRDVVIGFVGVAMIEMTKGNGTSRK